MCLLENLKTCCTCWSCPVSLLQGGWVGVCVRNPFFMNSLLLWSYSALSKLEHNEKERESNRYFRNLGINLDSNGQTGKHGHSVYAAAAAKSLQSCPTPCDPIDGSPPGSPVPGILQVRTLEWVAISFSNAGKWKVKVKLLSRVRLLATPWTAAYQAPQSMGISRQEYWSGVPLPSLHSVYNSL